MPKLLGTYEKEIHHCIESIISLDPDNLLIAGAAEGYFVTGFASRLPSCQIVAYEACDEARRELLYQIESNGYVNQVRVEGMLSINDLAHEVARAPGIAIFMDIEGGEAQVIDPVAIPQLALSPILAELHPWVEASLVDRLKKILTPSHVVEIIPAIPRKACELADCVPAFIRLFRSGQLEFLMNEFRASEMFWMYAKPRKGADVKPES